MREGGCNLYTRWIKEGDFKGVKGFLYKGAYHKGPLLLYLQSEYLEQRSFAPLLTK